MTNEEIQALVKSAYMEGWEVGWVTRHADKDNDNRVRPWLPPKVDAINDWERSEAKAEIGRLGND